MKTCGENNNEISEIIMAISKIMWHNGGEMKEERKMAKEI